MSLVVVTAFVGGSGEMGVLQAELFEKDVHADDAAELFGAQADGGGEFPFELPWVKTGEMGQLVDADLSLLLDDVIQRSGNEGIDRGR